MAPSTTCPAFSVRPALPSDVRAIRDLVDPLAARRILLPKELVGYYEAIQEFLVAYTVDVPGGGDAASAGGSGLGTPDEAGATASGRVLGAGALHVMWEDLAEVRTLAVADDCRGKGVGHALLDALTDRARDMGLSRLFCLTFETEFFARHGFEAIEGTVVSADVYAELLRSHDDGVAEFLDLARVKPNTLGNTRMLKHL